MKISILKIRCMICFLQFKNKINKLRYNIGKSRSISRKEGESSRERRESPSSKEKSAQQTRDIPQYIDCGFKGCDQKRLPSYKYFECEFCGGYFCGDHRHAFNHNCPKIGEEKEIPSRSPVTGVMRGQGGEIKVVVNPQRKGFPQGENEDTRNPPPGYQ